MLCILCLSGSDRMLQIFSQRGINLDISNIITKHFWLKPNPKLENSKFICRTCWNTVDVFHTFYKSIEEAHTVFTACLKQPDTESDNEEDISDLFTTVVKQEHPEETELESKEIPLTEPVDSLIKSDKENDITNSDESEPEELVVKLSPRSIKKNDDEKDESSDNVSDWNDGSHNQDNELQQNDTDSDSGSDYAASKKKTKKITRSYNVSELRKKGIPQREFDSFIKKNMELVCSVCNKHLDNFFFLKEHFRKAHKQDGYVTCCDKQFTSRFSLVHHLFLHQDPDLFKCSLCSRVLANKRSFEYHMRCHEAAKAPPTHKCEKCKKFFPSLPRLEKHLKTHVRKKSESICDQCGKVYNSAASLKCHQNRDHLGIVKPKERVQCQQCGVYLSDSYSLKFHIKHLHPEEKVIQSCHICGHVSATAYGLKRHIQYMHTMERVHKCNICEDKAFKTAQRLREHMTTHTGEVLYTCPHCPKTFNSNANMHSHRKKMHRKEWEENRRHPHMGHSAQASVNNANANAIANATEENNQQ